MKRKNIKLSESRFRAKLKKKRALPSRAMYDPFLEKVIYYNERGRVVEATR